MFMSVSRNCLPHIPSMREELCRSLPAFWVTGLRSSFGTQCSGIPLSRRYKYELPTLFLNPQQALINPLSLLAELWTTLPFPSCLSFHVSLDLAACLTSRWHRHKCAGLQEAPSLEASPVPMQALAFAWTVIRHTLPKHSNSFTMATQAARQAQRRDSAQQSDWLCLWQSLVLPRAGCVEDTSSTLTETSDDTTMYQCACTFI